MPTSVYFNNQAASREQFLLEDMVIESIRNHGIDVFYMPRTSQSTLDSLFGDDPVKYYDRAYKIEMYLETFNDFQGQQEFFSKFGLQIEKTARMAVARRSFDRQIPRSLRSLPFEGDLVYMPVQRKLMEIRFVEREASFFQLGKVIPYMFVLSMESWKYNGEFLNTGIEEIDVIVDDEVPSMDFTMASSNTASFIRGEVVYQGNDPTAGPKGIVTKFNRPEGILRVRNVKGVFAANTIVKGYSSGAQFNLTSYNGMENAVNHYEDNTLLQTEASNILDFSEDNPFGNP